MLERTGLVVKDFKEAGSALETIVKANGQTDDDLLNLV